MGVLDGEFMNRNVCDIWESRKSVDTGFVLKDEVVLLISSFKTVKSDSNVLSWHAIPLSDVLMSSAAFLRT